MTDRDLSNHRPPPPPRPAAEAMVANGGQSSPGFYSYQLSQYPPPMAGVGGYPQPQYQHFYYNAGGQPGFNNQGPGMSMGMSGVAHQPQTSFAAGVGAAGAPLMHFPLQYGYAHGMNVYPSAMPPPPPPSAGLPLMSHGMVYPTPPPPAPAPSGNEMGAVGASSGHGNSNGRGKRNAQQRSKNGVLESSKRRKTSGTDAKQNGVEVAIDPNELSADVDTDEHFDYKTPQQEEKGAYHSYCEACEKDFASPAAWEAHLAAHEQCSHPGCEFSATKKVLSAHWQLVHGQFSGTGLKDIEVEVEGQKKKFKVLVGTSPEEVEQWREERRKRFPSAANKQAKQAELEKVRSLGGVEATPNGGGKGKGKDKGSSSDIGGKQESGGGDVGSAHQEHNHGSVPETTSESAIGTGSSAGAASVGGGGPVKTTLCQYFTRGRCKHGEDCRYVHDKAAQSSYAEQRRKRQKMSASELEQLERMEHAKKGKLFLPRPLAGGERGTLLKRLLQDDISSEENIILQCFRYITASNFFMGDSDQRSLNT